jgi:hypothetical protein
MSAGAAFVPASALFAVLLCALFPMWLVAGVADWYCHRRTRLEATSGIVEWWLHVAQAAQIGAAMLVALLLEFNALALTLIGVLVLVHWLTAYLDNRYTHTRREIGPFEQQVHAVMTLVPVFAWALLVLAHPAAFERPEWRFDGKDPALRPAAIALVVGLTLLVDGLPLAEEGLRCARAARRRGARLSPPPSEASRP